MTVYIEYVILDNVIIDYLLLKATFSITNTRYNKKRLILSAFFGAGIALLYPLTESFAVLNTLVKLLSGLTITLIANSYSNIRSFYVNLSVFMLLTFLTGGAITGIFNLLNLDANAEISIALMILPAYAVINSVTSAVKSIYRKKEVRAYTYKTQLVYNEKNVTVSGFLDTGNTLFDEDSPVIVCGKKLFFSLIDGAVMKSGIKKISVRTVNGITQNLSFKLDKVLIYVEDKVNINNNVTVALSSEFIGDGYDVILNPALLKGESVNERTVKTQEVC